jgi:hypothetical protein
VGWWCGSSEAAKGVAELVNAARVGWLLAAARTESFTSAVDITDRGSDLPLPFASRGGGTRVCAGGEQISCRAGARSGY